MAGEAEDKLITVPECAVRRDTSRVTIYKAVKSGMIPAEKFGRDYLIKTSDCDAFTPMKDARERGKRGADKRWEEARKAKQGREGEG